MKILSLNCQKGYQPGLGAFLKRTLEDGDYDFILLQEFAKEVPNYVRGVGSYKLLEAHNEEMGEPSHLAIACRDIFELIHSNFKAFARMHPLAYLQHPGFGLLAADFDVGDSVVRLGNIHQHSGIRQSVRTTESKEIKRLLLESPDTMPTIFGGDFNLGFLGELSRTTRIFSPEFVCITAEHGPTLDSRYTEYHPVITNQIATALAKVNLGIKLKADHVFVDTKTAANSKIECRILPDRVSDHSPVEVVIS